jgi:integrase
MTTRLTAAGVAKLLPGNKRREIPDSGSPGLRLVIQTSGHKSWALRFRRPDGRPAKLTLGPVDLTGDETPDEPVIGQPLTLAAARKLASDYQRQRAFGRDVIADHNTAKRRRRTEAAGADAFAQCARRFIVEYAKVKMRTWATSAKVLGLKPATLEAVKGGLSDRWGAKPVGQITADDIHQLIDEIRERGVPGLIRRRDGMSNSMARVSAVRLHKFFGWLVQRRVITMNPCAGLWRPDEGPARDRVLTDQEVRWFWRACGDVGEPFGQVLKLLLLTGQRRREVAGMTRAELNGDTWTLLGDRTKNKKAHVVPLSQAARDLIAQVPVVGQRYVFTVNGRAHVTGWTKVKARLDARMRELAASETAALPPWRIHDLRRTCASGLQRLGVKLEVTEKILNHTSGSFGGIVGIYQRHDFIDERRKALTAWANHLDRITR